MTSDVVIDLPSRSPDSLPVVGLEGRKVAITWDTNTQSRLYVILFFCYHPFYLGGI